MKFKLRTYTNVWSWKVDLENNDHVTEVTFGIWSFRYFKKAPNKEWH